MKLQKITKMAILIVTFHSIVVLEVEARTSGTDVSSLITECSNIWPRFPPPNQLACYRTRTRSLGPFQTCDATLVRQTQISRVFGNENFTQYIVHTPGRLRDRSYNNRLLCRWNVECRSNQVLYMDITEHNIEPEQHSPLFGREVCVDYLELIRDFGMESSCGFRAPYTELEPHRIKMEFRSNRKLRFPGFRMRLACFNPELQDLEGCSPTNDLAVDQFTGLRIRREAHLPTRAEQNKSDSIPDRDVETPKIFIQKAHSQYSDKALPNGTLLKRQWRRIRRFASAQDHFVIDKTAKLLFKGNTLLIILNNAIKYNFKNITVLHTYDIRENIETFQSWPNRQQVFSGKGMLAIVENEAFYTIFGEDLDRFQPSPNETVIIRLLMEAEEKMLSLPLRDFIIDDKVLITDPPFPKPIPHPASGEPPYSSYRGKRQTAVFEPEVAEAARRGVNSCNAILRGVAQSILDIIDNL